MNPHNTTEEVFDDLPAATGSTEEIVRDIKRSLRGVMNAITVRPLLPPRGRIPARLPSGCRIVERRHSRMPSAGRDAHAVRNLW